MTRIHHPLDTVTTKWDTLGPMWLISGHSELRVRPHTVYIYSAPICNFSRLLQRLTADWRSLKLNTCMSTNCCHVTKLVENPENCWQTHWDANFRSIGVAAPVRCLQHSAVPDGVRTLQRLTSQRWRSDHQQFQIFIGFIGFSAEVIVRIWDRLGHDDKIQQLTSLSPKSQILIQFHDLPFN